eukprot:7861061-Prorocentrum_lima.AAC.1
MDVCCEVELERRMIALQAQAQTQLAHTKESEIAAQLELTSELRQKNQMLDAVKENAKDKELSHRI